MGGVVVVAHLVWDRLECSTGYGWRAESGQGATWVVCPVCPDADRRQWTVSLYTDVPVVPRPSGSRYGSLVEAVDVAERCDAEWYAPTANVCEQCGGQKVPGVLLGANGPTTVEACDECEVFESDLDAAFAVAVRVGGVVRFWQHDEELAAWVEDEVASGDLDIDYDPAEVGFELREYARPERHDDCLTYGQFPWVELDGEPVNWVHFRRITEALG